MTRTPDFDELLGPEPQGSERERLWRTHELLVSAGPPPELPAQLEAGPRLGTTILSKRRRRVRPMLLLAAALALLIALAIGLSSRGGETGLAYIQLRGTALAVNAHATLEVLPAQEGNWPMRLQVSGLPALSAPSYYVVYLVRGGRLLAPCGTFVVSNPTRQLTLTLNAPYRLEQGDTWVVTRQSGSQSGPGATVLRPARA